MASPFWKYFHEKLGWGLIHAPGPVAAIIKGLALRLDVVREDAVFTREQWYPQLCDPGMVPFHGTSRGLTRYYKETPEQFRQRVINAYAWHMLGGKQQGLPEILKFYGFDALEIENIAHELPSRWAEFQVALKEPGTPAELTDLLDNLGTLVWLINEYKPARSRLIRLHTDIYDMRPTIWTEGPAWSEGYYSFYSGVEVPGLGDDLLVSIGSRHAFQSAPFNPRAACGISQAVSVVSPYIDRPIWGHSDWGDLYPVNQSWSISDLYSYHSCEKLETGAGWTGEWDERTWGVAFVLGRKQPHWRMFIEEISRSQMIWGEEGKAWGGDDTVYGPAPFFDVENNPQVWSESLYSEHDCQIETVVVHEIFNQTTAIQSQRFSPQIPQATLTDCIAAISSPLHDEAWRGAWDDRRWYDYRTFAHVTLAPEEA